MSLPPGEARLRRRILKDEDMQAVGSQPGYRLTFARMSAWLLREMSRKHRLKDRVERALAVAKAFSIAVPGAIQLNLEVEAASGAADSGDPEQDLTELLVEIGAVAQANRSGALFLVDEMHNLDTPALAAICIAFRAGQPARPACRARRRRTARSPGAPDRSQAVRRPALSVPRARRLSDGAARAALVGPAATLGAEYDEKAALFAEFLRENHPLASFNDA